MAEAIPLLCRCAHGNYFRSTRDGGSSAKSAKESDKHRGGLCYSCEILEVDQFQGWHMVDCAEEEDQTVSDSWLDLGL